MDHGCCVKVYEDKHGLRGRGVAALLVNIKARTLHERDLIRDCGILGRSLGSVLFFTKHSNLSHIAFTFSLLLPMYINNWS